MTTTEMIAQALSATPQPVSHFVELTGKSDSTVRKALKEMVEADTATKTDDGFRTPVKTRANHGYARNTQFDLKATKRDQDVIDALTEAEQAKLVDIAEALSITVRAARHAVWRLSRNGLVEQVERGVYALVDQEAA